MKRWKSLTAALCAAVLLCGFSAVPAFAYADGGEGENYGDPTMTEETKMCIRDSIYAVLIQGIATGGDPIGAIWGAVGYTVLNNIKQSRTV